MLKVLKRETPESAITLIGFSLGGNITMKLLGELGPCANAYLKKAIAVSPPIDLYSSIRRIREPENKFYEKYFLKLLRENIKYLHQQYLDLPRVIIPENISFQEFDDLYTAPFGGFEDSIDYYNNAALFM